MEKINDSKNKHTSFAYLSNYLSIYYGYIPSNLRSTVLLAEGWIPFSATQTNESATASWRFEMLNVPLGNTLKLVTWCLPFHVEFIVSSCRITNEVLIAVSSAKQVSIEENIVRARGEERKRRKTLEREIKEYLLEIQKSIYAPNRLCHLIVGEGVPFAWQFRDTSPEIGMRIELGGSKVNCGGTIESGDKTLFDNIHIFWICIE